MSPHGNACHGSPIRRKNVTGEGGLSLLSSVPGGLLVRLLMRTFYGLRDASPKSRGKEPDIAKIICISAVQLAATGFLIVSLATVRCPGSISLRRARTERTPDDSRVRRSAIFG